MDGTNRDLRRLMSLLDARRQPGFGIVIDLGAEREKREARALLKKSRRLAQSPSPGGDGPSHDDGKE
jgi:hypothetical protein